MAGRSIRQRTVALIAAGLVALVGTPAGAVVVPQDPSVVATPAPDGPAPDGPADEATPPLVTVTGSYELLGSISAPGAPERAGYHAAVRDDSGRRVVLTEPAGDLVTGARVRITGPLVGGLLRPDSVAVLEQAPIGGEVSGTASVLVVMVQWTGPDATTADRLRTELATESRPWFTDVSYGRWTIATPTVTDWMAISPTDGCDYYGVMTRAIAAAEAGGFAPDTYDHVIIYHPTDADCGWGGLGYVGGRITWVNGYPESPLMIHELGHNLGLWHAMSMACVDAGGVPAVTGPSCTLDTYGDRFDAMGSAWVWDSATGQWGAPGHFSGTAKERLGWFDGRRVDVRTSGTITLVPLSRRAAGVQGARVFANGQTYWLEYRRPIGMDSVIVAAYPAVTDGVLIRHDHTETELLDLRPSTYASFVDATMPLGASWTSPEGVTFSVVARSATSLRVSVSFPTCGGLAPTIVGSGWISGTAGNDVILGSPGDDQIDAGGGADVVCGMAGNDTVLGGPGIDTVYGGDGDDQISGQAGDDQLRGNAGDDLCVKGSGGGSISTCERTQLLLTSVATPVLEPDAGSVTMGFELSIPIPTDLVVRTTVSTLDGWGSEPTETAVAGQDYVALAPTVFTIVPGSTSVTVPVAVLGDTVPEPEEGFRISMSNVSGGAIAANSFGFGLILDDDEAALPSLRINDIATAEGNSGSKAFTFTVSLARSSASVVTVKYRTVNGTATAGSDYSAVPLTVLTFQPGQTTKQVAVQVTGDRTVEVAERFFVDLSVPKGATIADNRGRATILNDD